MITENEFILRKERMISSAYTLFCKNGIDATSMKQIAKKAGVSEISLYRYFGNKVTLLTETQKILWDNILNQIEVTIFENSNYEALSGFEQIKLHLRGFYSLVDCNSDYILFITNYKAAVIKNKSKLDIDALTSNFKKPVASFKRAIEKGQADGSIKNKTDAAILAETFWNIMRSYSEQVVVYDALSNGTGNSYRDNFDNLFLIMYSSLLAE